jgi:UPF0042 nucleotide-binding protein
VASHPTGREDRDAAPLHAGRVVVVTGMSGAGKSTALHALEDLGFFCIDNLPPAVVEHAVEACEEEDVIDVALGLHVRVRSFLEGAAAVIHRMGRAQRKPPAPPPSRPGIDLPGFEATPPPGPTSDPAHRRLFVLFLDASDESLVRRFSETRRPHPLAVATEAPANGEGAPSLVLTPSSSEVGPVIDGVRLERERLAPLRDLASVVLDTSHLTVHQLRKRVMAILSPERGAVRMETRVVSFGFKYGLPTDANVVLDVRFLDNPYFVDGLRPMTGLDAPVRDFVMKAEDATAFLDRAQELLAFSLPRYEREGKSYLTVGVGCTGGQHRSVALAEELAARLRRKTGMTVTAAHRDIARAAPKPWSGP